MKGLRVANVLALVFLVLAGVFVALAGFSLPLLVLWAVGCAVVCAVFGLQT